MSKVILGDVSVEHKETCKGSKDGYPIVGLEHLKNYEFELPPMDKQRKLVSLLWAMVDTKKSYQKQIASTNKLVNSQFIGPIALKDFSIHASVVRRYA